jgi:hypothetical protein
MRLCALYNIVYKTEYHMFYIFVEKYNLGGSNFHIHIPHTPNSNQRSI